MKRKKQFKIVGDVFSELKKVTWPSKEETVRLTAVVVIISLIISVYIGIIDFLLAKVLNILAVGG